MNEAKIREDIERTVNEYSKLIYRTSLLMLGNAHDADDVLQETFIKYMTSGATFNDEEHKKAWLLKVSQNLCKNLLRLHRNHAYVPLDDLVESIPDYDQVSNLEIEEFIKIANLKPKYKSVVILRYVENYEVKDVAKILGISESATKMILKRAREILKVVYEKKYREVAGHDF